MKTVEEIEAAIKEISEILKGPRIPDIERLILYAERGDLRATLADLKRKPVGEKVQHEL